MLCANNVTLATTISGMVFGWVWSKSQQVVFGKKVTVMKIHCCTENDFTLTNHVHFCFQCLGEADDVFV